MSERKVLTKYYPPDFDPSQIARTRKPKDAVAKLPTVRLMAPFSMKCTSCGDYSRSCVCQLVHANRFAGEYIYKGRKFNARKEITDERYYDIKIIRLYIRCTRCSAEITFKTDPKNTDYTCEKGAKRNFEPWREAKLADETEEERLDRLEAEAAEKDAMKELETKTLDAKTEMAIADALDEIRTRNARMEKVDKDGSVATVTDVRDEERERQERADEEAARRAFHTDAGEKIRRLDEHTLELHRNPMSSDEPQQLSTEKPTFQRTVKRRKDSSLATGIKKKPKLAA